MKFNKALSFITGGVLAASLSVAISETTQPEAETAEAPVSAAAPVSYESCDATGVAGNEALKTALEAMIDPEVMASTMADPAKFNEFMMTMMNPANMQTFNTCSVSSDYWQTAMTNMADPAKYMNATAKFMDPATYTNWMAAMMNPSYYMNWMAVFMNPSYYMNWMAVSMNPATYQPMFKMMDPANYVAQASTTK